MISFLTSLILSLFKDKTKFDYLRISWKSGKSVPRNYPNESQIAFCGPLFRTLHKTSMPKPVKSLWYIKCYNPSSPRPIKSPSNSTRYKCQMTYSLFRRPRWWTILLFTSFSKTTNPRTNYRDLNTENTRETFQQSGKQFYKSHESQVSEL